MYGLKPVPFKLKPVPFKLKPVPFKLKPVPFKGGDTQDYFNKLLGPCSLGPWSLLFHHAPSIRNELSDSASLSSR